MILQECPTCHDKGKVSRGKTQTCKKCGEDFIKAKKAEKVRYWVKFRMPGGKQVKQYVGTSVEEARDLDGKRRGQKRERRFFEMETKADKTAQELADWYLTLDDVAKLKTLKRVKVCLDNFCEVYGSRFVSSLDLEDFQKYQERRTGEGKAPATIDMEVKYVKSMLTKGFQSKWVSSDVIRFLPLVGNQLETGKNAREQTFTVEQYLIIKDKAAIHLKPIVVTALHTGMRKGEITGLEWKHIDWKAQMIRLPADRTKEKRPKRIPINRYVKEILESLPRPIHHDYVFTYKGKPISSNFRRSLARACKDAGLVLDATTPEGVRFHDFRATAKTLMANAGVDKELRDIILGHSLPGMDNVYLRFSDEDLHRAMGQYTEYLEAQFTQARESGPQNGPQEGVSA